MQSIAIREHGADFVFEGAHLLTVDLEYDLVDHQLKLLLSHTHVIVLVAHIEDNARKNAIELHLGRRKVRLADVEVRLGVARSSGGAEDSVLLSRIVNMRREALANINRLVRKVNDVFEGQVALLVRVGDASGWAPLHVDACIAVGDREAKAPLVPVIMAEEVRLLKVECGAPAAGRNWRPANGRIIATRSGESIEGRNILSEGDVVGTVGEDRLAGDRAHEILRLTLTVVAVYLAGRVTVRTNL